MPEKRSEQFQERLDDFVEIIDEGDIIQDEGTENLISGLNMKSYLLGENHPVHSFSLSELRRFPRYLCDSLLIPHTTVVALDNHLYWGWTAAFFSHYQTSNEQTDSESMSIMNDFYSLIHLCLLPTRQGMMDQRISQFINSMNPSIQGIQHQGYSHACSVGFSVLDGLIKRHCADLETEGGLSERKIQNPSWRTTPIDDPIYHDILQIWKEREATEDVAKTLRKIDDLSRYREEVIARKIGGGEESVSNRGNFLSVFSDQRNTNIHGELSTQAIGPVVLNFCCLLLWDKLTQEEFKSVREEILERLEGPQMGGMTGIHPRWPSAFYPL